MQKATYLVQSPAQPKTICIRTVSGKVGISPRKEFSQLLCNLFQCLTSYTMNHCFLVSHFSFPCYNSCLLAKCCLCAAKICSPDCVVEPLCRMGAVLTVFALVSCHKMCDKFPHFGEGGEHVNFPSTIYHLHSLLQVKTKEEETQKPYRFLYSYYRTFSKSVV